MKKKLYRLTLLLFMMCIGLRLQAQSPQLINYQGVLRDSQGVPVPNQNLAIKFEILAGSDTGPVIYTDDQPSGVKTNNLGLFTTQIGKNAPLSQVNWQTNQTYFLRIQVDPNGGSNYQILGSPQAFNSVPFALHAASVPASYTNNVLSIGNNTFSINSIPLTSVSLSGVGTVSTTGTNSFDINIPAPSFSNTGQTIIGGTYPNYIVNTPTVPPAVTPSISITNTAAATSTVVSSGNSFSINVPPATFTNTGQTLISGTYPNFTVNTPTIPATPTVSAAGIATVSAGPNYLVGVQSPTFTNTGQTIISGTYPNFSVATPTVAGTSIALTSTAAAGPSITTVGTNSFNLNIPPASFVNNGPVTITGTSPNFTLNSPNTVTYTAGTGISITSGSIISNTSPNITPTIALTSSAAAGPSVTNTGSSFSINIPPAITPSMYANGIASVSPVSGNSFTVSVAQPTFAYSQTNGSLTSGTASAYITPNLTFSNGVITSGPSSNSIAINNGTNAAWSSLGNAGTSTVSNFIGTTDAVELNFRVNNQRAGRIETASNSLYFGYLSGPATNTAANNTGIGYNALNANTSGYGNTAIGYLAGRVNTSGFFNTAIGGASQWGNSTGIQNTSVGYQSLRNNVGGSNNVVIGVNAIGSGTAGSFNTALGFDAGYNSTGDANVFIGYRAGYFETGSNKLWIANSTTSTTPLIYGDFISGNVGIGTSTPSDRLELGSYNSTQNNYLSIKTAGGNSYISGIKLTHFNTDDGFTIESNETVNRLDFIRHATTSFTVMSIDRLTGNIGIGTTSSNAPLQFGNIIQNRKIVLWEDVNNDHQFYGFGINGSTLRYQTSNTSADHVFYAGTSTSTSDELFRIKGTGMIKMGTETGTGQGPAYPSGGGMMLRRLFTTNITAGEVIARTDQMTFERDGTFGGFRITNNTGSGNEVCNCIGTTNLGVSFNRALNNLGIGTTAVYADANNIVYFHCMFGDPYNAGHITEVTFTRQYPDYFWVGTVMTTFNQ